MNLGPSEADMKAGPKIYFRGVNRIQINRFKAYTQILSNRLKQSWSVTDDLADANVVATNTDPTDSKSKICLSLYDSPPNLNPKPISQVILSFDENNMVKQLNLASKKLKSTKFRAHDEAADDARLIKLSGSPDQIALNFCDQLNNESKDDPKLKFTYLSNPLDDNSSIFINHLLFVIDPTNLSSVNAFFQLEKKTTTR